MFKKAIVITVLMIGLNVVIISLHSCCGRAKCRLINVLEVELLEDRGDFNQPVSNEEVVAVTAVLQLIVRTNQTTCYKPTPALINTALAWQCPDPVIKNKVVGFSVISDQDFNSDFKAGMELKSLFKIPRSPDSSSFFGHDNAFQLYLTHSPEKRVIHTFTVRLSLDNGDTLSASTIPARIL